MLFLHDCADEITIENILSHFVTSCPISIVLILLLIVLLTMCLCDRLLNSAFVFHVLHVYSA